MRLVFRYSSVFSNLFYFVCCSIYCGVYFLLVFFLYPYSLLFTYCTLGLFIFWYFSLFLYIILEWLGKKNISKFCCCLYTKSQFEVNWPSIWSFDHCLYKMSSLIHFQFLLHINYGYVSLTYLIVAWKKNLSKFCFIFAIISLSLWEKKIFIFQQNRIWINTDLYLGFTSLLVSCLVLGVHFGFITRDSLTRYGFVKLFE